MKPSQVVIGIAVLMATAAGAYTLGTRRAAPPSAPAVESSPAAKVVPAPEADGERAARRQPVVEGSPAPTDAEGRTRDALTSLASSNARERSDGLRALAKADRAQAAARARGMLDDPGTIRAAASVILAGTPEAVAKEIPGVRRALDRCACDAETKAAVMGTILQATNYASPAEARKLAAEMMASKSPEARRAAVPLLQNLGANDAVPLLLEALDDPDAGTRAAALATLRTFSHHDHGDAPEAWRAWWRTANQGR